MTTKYRFEPVPEANVHTLLPSSRFVVYASGAIPGAVSLMMVNEQAAVRAGTRLTREQAVDLIRALAEIIEDEDATTQYDLGYAAGHKEGQRNGFNEGWDDGYDEGNAEGWEQGYAKGLEDGAEGVA